PLLRAMRRHRRRRAARAASGELRARSRPARPRGEKSGRFAHLRHAAPSRMLESGEWRHASGRCCWELLKGDFRESIDSAPLPDLIFYDPFSYKTDAALWTVEIFARIFQRALPKAAELYTYSASTAVRAALLAAGFFVAQGIGTGP